MAGLDVASPQLRHVAGDVLETARRNDRVGGVDDELHRHADVMVGPERAWPARGQRPVDLERVRGVGRNGIGAVALVGRDTVGQRGLTARSGEQRTNGRRTHPGDRERDHVGQPKRPAQRTAEPDGPIRPGQVGPDGRGVVVRARPRHRGERGDALGGGGAAQILPGQDRTPVVAKDVDRLTGAERVDHRTEVVGQALGGIRLHRRRHRGPSDAAVVVADDAEPVGEQRDDAVPQHMRVGPAVDQHDRRPVGVAFLVGREANPVGTVHECRGGFPRWRRSHQTSTADSV